MSVHPADDFAITLAQLNPTVGDIDDNLAKARDARERARADGSDLVVFPELFLSGYPPEDLVQRPAFQAACRTATNTLARDTADGGPAVLIGCPWSDGGRLYNAVLLLEGGRIAAVRFKVNLPNYGVFDEARVFSAGPMPGPVNLRGVRLGIPVCEDIWGEDVVECLVETGAELLIVPNGSPYWRGKGDLRLNVTVARVIESGLPLIYLNQIGGQDELVFDGASFALHADRTLALQLPAFEEAVVTTRWSRLEGGWRCIDGPQAQPWDDSDKADYAACVLGLRDYVEKCGFPGVVLGVSGGIDSALCAVMATDALGAERVRAVMLPSRYTTPQSVADAATLAKTLAIPLETLSIEAAVKGLETALAPALSGHPHDVTEENLQARARGTMLMALSNKFGLMLLTTGNKSEMSTGYATLYGDMNGGFNPLKDLYKTEVYRLARLRNVWKPPGARGPDGPVIPESIIGRPPTAELREDQCDQDTLPPYEVLDAVLERLVEREKSVADIVAEGFDRDIVLRVEHMLAAAEYKRRQAPPGVKVTMRNFGRDRRYPIANRFRDKGDPLPAPNDSPLPRPGPPVPPAL